MNWTFLYVAIVYFAAVALWRFFRGGELPWRVAIFFYALVLIFLFRPMTQSYVNVPADYLNRLYPWSAVTHERSVHNSEINDVILQMVPWAHQVRESWKRLEVPLWNDASGGGYPLLANGQSAALSPFRIVSIPLSLGESFTSEAALKILVGLTGAFLYLRRRVSFAPALIGSAAYGFSSYIIVWLHFPHSSVASLLPVAFYAIDLLFERATQKRFIFAAAIFAVIFLGGHPESAAHIGFACALYLAFRSFTAREARWKKFGVAAAAAVFGILLAAPFIIPFLEALPRSQRYELLQHERGSSYSANVPSLIQLFQPRFFGLLKDHYNLGPGFAEMVCGSAGVLGFIGWWAALLQFVRRRKWTDERTFHLFAFALVAGVALSWPGISHLFEMLPLFSLAANARLRLVLCWFSAVLGALLIEQLVRNRAAARGAAAIVAFILLVAFTAYLPNAGARAEAFMTSLPALGVIVAVLVMAALEDQRRARLALLMIVTLEVWTFAYSWNPTVEASRLFPSLPITRYLTAQRDAMDGEPFRIAALTATFFPNSSAMFGLEDVRAHDPMANGRVLGMLRAFTGYTSDEYFAFLPHGNHAIIDFLNVRYFIASPTDSVRDPKFITRYHRRDGKVFENRLVYPRFFAPARVVVEHDDLRRISALRAANDWRKAVFIKTPPAGVASETLRGRSGVRARVATRQTGVDSFIVTVDAPEPVFIASSQPAWPGWVARRDGEPLALTVVNEAFWGFAAPKGRSTIVFRYEPPSFRLGVAVCAATLLGLALSGLALRRIAY